MKSASVVICTRNQAPRLRLILRALSVQTIPPHEVIVVDDASTDETATVITEARNFIRTCEVKHVRNEQQQWSPGARNEGARQATGDFLVFLDGDALATRDHLKHHLELQSSRGPVVAVGPLWHTTKTEYLRNPSTGERFNVAIPPQVQKELDEDLASMLIREEDVLERFSSIVERSAPGCYPGLAFMEAEAERLGDTAGHPTAWILMIPHNASVPRAVFQRFGGFDAELPFSEGWDFTLRLHAGGVPMLRVPGAPTYHIFHYRRFADFDEHLRRWRAMTMIARKNKRRSLFFGPLLFSFKGQDRWLPEEAGIQDLDQLAALIASHENDLGPYEVLLRGHPLVSELEGAVTDDKSRVSTPAAMVDRLSRPSRKRAHVTTPWPFERVAGPFSAITEGSVWDGECVLFADIPNKMVRRYDPKTKSCEVHAEDTFGGNGLALDEQGRLLVCEGGTPRGGRRIVRYERDGKRTILAESYRGRRLNAPNDIAIDRRGRIWFSDPCYGNRMTREHESIYHLDHNLMGHMQFAE